MGARSARPTGKLDLIVHGGGFPHGAARPPPVRYAQFDIDEGTTVVSIGYRLLKNWPWPAPVNDIAHGLDEGYQSPRR